MSTAAAPDLWGDLNLEEVRVSTPAGLMRQQAALLASKTNGKVGADVIVSVGDQQSMLLRFELMAPALPLFRHNLFAVLQDINGYPVEVLDETRRFIKDSSEFESWLKDTLGNPEVKRKIKILMEAVGNQSPVDYDDET